MNWITQHDDALWKIELNANFREGDNYFYKWGKSFIRITMKTAGQKSIDVNYETYTMYSAGEEIIVEITDYVRTINNPGYVTTFPITYLTVNDYSVDFQVINGAYGNEFRAILPKEIPLYTGLPEVPFYVQLTQDMYGEDSIGPKLYDVSNNTYGGVYSWDWTVERTQHGMKPLLYTYISPTRYTHFINQSCWTDKILVEWISAFGFPKSWWFQVDGEIYGSDKMLNLQTMENGYYTLKNKRVSVRIKHARADNTTQKYLSDIAMSDEVYVYDDDIKTRVRLADNAFEVTQGKRDVQLMINKYAYDTI